MAGIHCVLLGSGGPQRFPDVATVTEGETTSTDTLAVSSGSMPAHTPGQLLVAVFACVSSSAPNIATNTSGWTKQASVAAAGGIVTEIAVFTKTANTSSESITAESDGSGDWAWQVLAVDYGTEGGAVDQAAEGDPPSVTLTNNQKYLVFALAGARTASYTAAPSGYSDFNATGSSARLGTATKQVENVSSESPGAFSGGGSSSKVAITLAIRGT